MKYTNETMHRQFYRYIIITFGSISIIVMPHCFGIIVFTRDFKVRDYLYQDLEKE